MSEIMDIEKLRKEMTREEFLKYEEANNDHCPDKYDLKDIKPCGNCSKCWKLAIKDLEFKEEIPKFEDIKESGISGISLSYSSEYYFLEQLLEEEDLLFIDNFHDITIDNIEQFTNWINKVNKYCQQNKLTIKELTKEGIEERLGYKIKIINKDGE